MLSKAEKNLILGEKVTVGADERQWKTPIPSPHPPSAKVPPLLEDEGSLLDHGFCDSALRLRAE